MFLLALLVIACVSQIDAQTDPVTLMDGQTTKTPPVSTGQVTPIKVTNKTTTKAKISTTTTTTTTTQSKATKSSSESAVQVTTLALANSSTKATTTTKKVQMTSTPKNAGTGLYPSSLIVMIIVGHLLK